MNLEDFIKNLPPELQEKARACGSASELLALARAFSCSSGSRSLMKSSRFMVYLLLSGCH